MNKNELLRAVELALEHKWDEAHNLVQKYEDDAMASWIHAVLHKIEGEVSNSRYWYRRAGKSGHENEAPEQELQMIKAALSGAQSEGRKSKLQD
jgi:hypothetical protein